MAVTIAGVSCDRLLIDGSSLIFRAFYGAQRRVKDADALRTAAIGGFLFRLGRLIVERSPVRIAVGTMPIGGRSGASSSLPATRSIAPPNRFRRVSCHRSR